MILQSLAQYYDRLLNDPNTNIAPPGWFQGRLDYLILLKPTGDFVSVRSLKREEGKRFVGRKTI